MNTRATRAASRVNAKEAESKLNKSKVEAPVPEETKVQTKNPKKRKLPETTPSA